MSDNFIHAESNFELAIIEHLCNHGWQEGCGRLKTAYALNVKTVVQFILSSQITEGQ